MSDFSVLKTKLADPVIVALPDDAAIIDALNAATIATKQPINVIDIEKYLAAAHKYIPIIDSADINAREAVLALSKFTSFDTLNATYLATLTGILDGLVTAGLLVAADKTYILGMADTTTSWAAQNWGGNVTLTDIANARSYI